MENNKRNLTKRKWFYVIVSIFFATLFWTFVIADTNPVRTIEIKDVKVEYRNLQDLSNNDLILRNTEKLATKVSVEIEGNLNMLQYVNSENVYAFIDFSKINATGEYDLNIQAYTTASSVAVRGVRPVKATVSIDKKGQKKVPITAHNVGKARAGFYAKEPVLKEEFITITGPVLDLEKISRAVCNVDVNGVIEDINGSYPLELLDIENNTIKKEIFSDNILSTIVQVDVIPQKNVIINTTNAIQNKTVIAKGYEIVSIVANPNSINIAGDANLLKTISGIGIEAINAAGAKDTFTVSSKLVLPKGIYDVDGIGEVEITVTLRQKTN